MPTLGAVHAVITGSTVTGKFDDYTFAPGDNAAGITWLPEYTATAVNLYAVPSNYATAVPGLNANQTQVGAALQSLRNSGLKFELDQRTTMDDRATLFNGLKTQTAAGLRTAYDQLTPEKLTALAATTFQSASILNSSLQQRSAELRRYGSASISLNGVATPAAAEDYSVQTVIEDGVSYQIAKAKPKKRFGYFASATGAFAAVDGSSDRLGSFSQTGAATAGVDYALNPNQSVGLVVSQALADTDFSSNSGTARTTTSRVGVFHDYHNAGFFVNTSVSAGLSAYDSKRKIAFLNQTASGETQGFSYGGQLATGYDFKVGGFIVGPTASVAYDHAHINGFEETGSAADLRVRRQNADSFITKFGVHVSRPFVANKIGWIPDLSLSASRQSFNPNRITARLAAGGEAFRVNPQAGGSEYINPGASLSALLPNGWTVRLSYDAILNPQYSEHRVNLSLNAGF
ncbi:MAG: autotransporter outer membrane beta-barrel domain-containing protein [Opitutus sp.]|nr:autotransporter outer membrane beta-barrel domain-containing protein [Opitutus sp.]MCS6277047.1 autotransporter outer membrane beta-barrel domain-containing protein [Opitutus sp.]MCS6300169.1 autotransporter outer membrane beta-barrel domain-containing protein [Opitutus sp.]